MSKSNLSILLDLLKELNPKEYESIKSLLLEKAKKRLDIVEKDINRIVSKHITLAINEAKEEDINPLEFSAGLLKYAISQLVVVMHKEDFSTKEIREILTISVDASLESWKKHKDKSEDL